MISLHNILSISKYERKTLLRSWFFRIFGILSLLVLFGMNFGMVIQGGGGDGWAIRSISSAIPYFNLLILNVTQAIIAVFLASDFLKRDKKLDTTEVIYMRSMTNGEYVIGKTWGNLQVFLILNVIVVLLAIIMNSLAKGTEINWISYPVYLVLISIPTLIFIMGLSFLLMSVIRNQAITFVLVLGYIGITLFLLQAKYYYIFDYMAFNIPMLKSGIVGFGNLDVILGHRGIYFFLGIGFILLTIFLLKRLPQSESMTLFSLIFGILFILAGGYLAYNHINRFNTKSQIKADAIELNNKYVKGAIPTVQKHTISLEHKGDIVDVISAMTLKNQTKETLKKIVLSLNNGLIIKSLKIDERETPFLREMHLIVISDNISLNPEEEIKVEMLYSGKIDETLCYLDIDEAGMQEKYGKFVINVDKRFAFITPEYVLLTPEANWYPKTGVTYSSNNMSWNQTQFVNFTLKVKTSNGLKAISQGKISETTTGQFAFENETPLTQISLAIGNYREKKIEGENIDFVLWHFDGHDYFSNVFPESKDTIATIIKDRMGDFERSYNLTYPFKRFSLIEVPAQFKTFERAWVSSQESVQPEQVFIPEKGYTLRAADFEGVKKMMKSGRMGGPGGGGGGDMTPLDVELRVLYEFFGTFTSETQRSSSGGRDSWMNSRQVQSPYFIFPMLYNFQNNIQSAEWPITNRIFEAFLKNQITDMRALFSRGMSGENEDELANIALQDSTFAEILSDNKQKRIIDNAIKLKGDVLFSNIQLKAGQAEFKDFLKKILEEYRFKNIPFEEFDNRINEKFGLEITPIMNDWFSAKSLPGFLFSPVKVVKVKTGDMMKSMVSLKVTNFTNVEGLVKISFRLGGFGGPGGGSGRGSGGGMGGGSSDVIDKLVFLEAHQTKDLSYLLNSDPRMIILNTLTSKNIPQTLTSFFREISEDLKAKPLEGEVISDIPVKSTTSNEIILDNEDKGFEVTKNTNENLLQKWILREKTGTSKYSSVNWWRPPINWTATTGSDFYGEFIRSAYYLKKGDGSLKARWNVPLKKPGYYEVYYHFYKSRGFSRGRDSQDEKGEYNFIIHSADGEQQQALDSPSSSTGWNLLGTFQFEGDTALIELTNKSALNLIYADAVKLIEQ